MPAASVTLVVHGHFYQPPRENPWTGEVAREATAAPFHDWNERIAEECYRPNAFVRIVDDRGRIVAICNTFDRLSFDVGPTLMSWLQAHRPDTYQRIVEAGRLGGAIPQAFSHLILPLATPRDIRTQIRWGLADFRHRFGRDATGMWLPEAAVNPTVLAILAEEGVGFTILAPGQATRVRPLDGRPDRPWTDVDGAVDTRRAYRWRHPVDPDLGVDVVFFHGGLSHSVAFELSGLSSQALVDRVIDAGGSDGGLVLVATDGETFGHHQRWGDRLVGYALAVEAPRRGVEVTDVAGYVAAHPPEWEVDIREGAWSCAHGVGRWVRDCGCSTGGGTGWNQRWRTPLRSAIDGLAGRAAEVFERRGGPLFTGGQPWAARDAYAGVVVGAESVDAFAGRYVTAATEDERVAALTLLEIQRHAMSMYTSCGWFFNDLAGLETVQVLRYAARVMDLLSELGEDPGAEAFGAELAWARSNTADVGDGRAVWRALVEPARVDGGRVAAHLALIALLDGSAPPDRLAGYAVLPVDSQLSSRGSVALASGQVALRHLRTGRRTTHAYAAIRLGGLEVIGAVRDTGPDQGPVAGDLRRLRDAFDHGAPLTTLLRLVTDAFGPREFGLMDALPDAAEQLAAKAASALADRFTDTCQHLFDDHRVTLESLAAIGQPLPPVLRLPAELALARRLEAEVSAQGGALDPSAYRGALAIIEQARAAGLHIATPSTQAAGERLLLEAVRRAVAVGVVGQAVVVSEAGAVRQPGAGGSERRAGWVRRSSDERGLVGAVRPVGLELGTSGPPEWSPVGDDDDDAAADADADTDAHGAVALVVALLDLAAGLELSPRLERPQELVYDALLLHPTAELRRLGDAIGLAVDALAPPWP